MPTKSEFRDLALLRLEEANALFAVGKYDGCVYLCGYVVEMALKAAVCQKLAVDPYPESNRAFKVHDFDTLVLLSGLRQEVANLTGELRSSWLFVTDWDTSFRYTARNSYNRDNAKEWLDAIENPLHGVLPWLQTKW